MSLQQPGRWNPIRQGIFLLDALVRRASGYREFSQDPKCIFRIVWSRAPHAYTFASGTRVEAQAPVVAIHFWNEHIPPMPPAGPDMQWALVFYRRLRYSLVLLARYLASHPRGPEIEALYGRIFLSFKDDDPGLRLLQRLGFELKPVSPPSQWPGRVGFFFVRGYAYALAWAYNPGSVHNRSRDRKRLTEVWMSRRTLWAYRTPSTVPSGKEVVS